jgi:transcriptional regulator with XRE-family HTH domain
MMAHYQNRAANAVARRRAASGLVTRVPAATPAAQEIRIGGRLKHARLVKGLTLREVANQAGCSESLLSKIENERATPSLGMLHQITAALGTNISTVFEMDGDPKAIVCEPQDRPVFVSAEGIQVERLIPFVPGRLLQASIHLIAPGSADEPVVHQGEELGYVLEGELEVIVGQRSYTAKAGSAFVFRSEIPHHYRNCGEVPVRVIWVNTPATY